VGIFLCSLTQSFIKQTTHCSRLVSNQSRHAETQELEHLITKPLPISGHLHSTYIATGQDRGLGRHLLVDTVLQASQVEVGISRKETENNAGSMGTSETDSVSDTGVTYRIETNRSNQQGDQDSRKDVQAQPN
jgi:hypothetical protein